MIRRSLALLLPLALLLAACDRLTAPEPYTEADLQVGQRPAPLHAAGDRIPDQYIVVFKSGVRDAPGLAQALVQAHGGSRLHSYQHALQGFAARLSPQAVEALRRNPNVAYIEQDAIVHTTTTLVQRDAPWGLDRIDQRDLPLNTTYTYTADGTGVTVYIFDTGIHYAHAEFAGRASFGFDVFGGDGSDCNGHGTHVAGTVGGTTYGVAKGVTLRSVRVLGCSGFGSWSGVIAGINWVTEQKQASPATPMVANMSLGGPNSQAMTNAVQNSIAAGVAYVVAAGNDNSDACNDSPGSTPEAITVGATNANDERVSPLNSWWGSNWGSCVDIFAPGTAITSAWWTSDTATENMPGTSVSAPHVAGVAALYLQNHPAATSAEVTSAIISTSTLGRVGNPGVGSPNRLLFSGLTPEPPAPVIIPSVRLLVFTFLRVSDSQVLPEPSSGDFRHFRLSNPGALALEWTASSNQPWLSVTPSAGSLAANDASTWLRITVDATTLGVGSHTGEIIVAGPDAPNSPQSVAVRVDVLPVTPLYLDTPITGLSGAGESAQYFEFEVADGNLEHLIIQISGGTGNADLYVRYGAPPTLLTYDCRPWRGGNEETCTFSPPGTGSYWVMLRPGVRYADVTLIVRSSMPTTTTLTLEPAQQQYSDRTRLRASLSPTAATGSVQFQRSTDGGATFANLGSPITVAGGSASLDFQVTEAAGTDVRFRAVFTGTGVYGNSISSAQPLTVTREDATILYAGANPTALVVSTAGGSLNAGALTLTLGVQEKEPDVAVSPGSTGIGNIANSGLQVTLVPVGPGSSHTLTCSATGVSGSGYAATRNFTCTNAAALPVTTYEVQANVTGGFYAGSYTDAFTVYDPSLGFATGGGTFVLDGERVNFGFTLRYNRNGNNLRGNFLAVRHHADGTVSRLKSNALGSLALGEDTSVPMGWASFDGRATYTTWDASAGDYVTVGNQSFAVYAEDRNHPGSGTDHIWVRGPAALNLPGTPSQAKQNTVPLTGGDISVPHEAAGGKR